MKYINVIILALTLCLPMMTAQAQDAESAPVVKQLNIAVVDVQQLMNESKAAKSIQSQGQSLRKKYEKKIDKLEKELKSSEKAVISAGKDGDKEQFIERRQEFQKELMDSQKSLAEMNQKMDKAVAKALNVLQEAIVDIIDDMTAKNQYDLVMTRADIVTVSKDIDITADVMKQLNKKLKTVKVRD